MSQYIKIPTVIDPGCVQALPSGLSGIVRAAADGRGIFPIVGECMEAAGIEDGGFIAVDFTRSPRPPRTEGGRHIHGDPCLCYASAPMGEGKAPPAVMCKEYCGRWMGRMVGTRYDTWKGGEYRMDCAFPADAILGVVFAAWGRDGRLKWRNAPSCYPTELQEACTIKGGNVAVETARKIRHKEEPTE